AERPEWAPLPSAVNATNSAPERPRILASTLAVYGKFACPRVWTTPLRRSMTWRSLRRAASVAVAAVTAQRVTPWMAMRGIRIWFRIESRNGIVLVEPARRGQQNDAPGEKTATDARKDFGVRAATCSRSILYVARASGYALCQGRETVRPHPMGSMRGPVPCEDVAASP